MSGFSLQEIVAIIGALGVISSFVYAAIQVRRNTLATRAQMYVQVSAAFYESWEATAQDPQLCDILLRSIDGLDQFTQQEVVSYQMYIKSYMRRVETAFFLHKLGILTDQDWAGITGDMREISRFKGFQDSWPSVRTRSSPEFQAHIDRLVAKLSDEAAPAP